MAFCTRCGAATQPNMAFCAACGAPLAQAPPAPSAAPPPAQPAAARPSYATPPGYLHPPPGYVPPPRATGPLGRTMEPWLVVVLTLVTFGIYALVYWWRVTREMDEHLQKPGHSHRLAQIGTFVIIAGSVALAFTIASFIAAAIAAEASGNQTPDEAMIAAILGSVGIFILSIFAIFGGRIALLVAKYRVWQGIEEQERARGHAPPLNLGLMLALAIGGLVLGGIGTILNLILQFMTQERLNLAWVREP